MSITAAILLNDDFSECAQLYKLQQKHYSEMTPEIFL